MSENSKIEWCDHTFNPWEGCQKVGPGCDHCYAETRNARFSGGTAVNWGPGAPRRRTSTANWRKPLAWNAAHNEFFATHGRRQRVFCASLADVFDSAVSAEWRADLFELIERTKDLDWLLLTKRIGNVERMVAAATDLIDYDEGWQSMWGQGEWPDNVWLGATIVNQEEAARDIPKLLAIPARVRFLSMEPLLGPVDLGKWTFQCCGQFDTGAEYMGQQERVCCGKPEPSGELDWVIVGGESGPGARPMHPGWARSLCEQCLRAGVPFLFKQWGEWAPGNDGPGGDLFERDRTRCASGFFDYCDRWHEISSNPFRQTMDRVGKRAAGRLLDGRTHDEFPEAR